MAALDYASIPETTRQSLLAATYKMATQMFQDPAMQAEYRAKRKRRTDGHKNPFRISCRMDGETYKKLIGQIRQDGFRTVQDWILDQVLAYISARSDDP